MIVFSYPTICKLHESLMNAFTGAWTQALERGEYERRIADPNGGTDYGGDTVKKMIIHLLGLAPAGYLDASDNGA
jgi:hypothetical protein